MTDTISEPSLLDMVQGMVEPLASVNPHLGVALQMGYPQPIPAPTVPSLPVGMPSAAPTSPVEAALPLAGGLVQKPYLPFTGAAPDLPSELPIPVRDMEREGRSYQEVLKFLPLMALFGGSRFAANTLGPVAQGLVRGVEGRTEREFDNAAQGYTLGTNANQRVYGNERHRFGDDVSIWKAGNDLLENENNAALRAWQANESNEIKREAVEQRERDSDIRAVGLQINAENKDLVNPFLTPEGRQQARARIAQLTNGLVEKYGVGVRAEVQPYAFLDIPAEAAARIQAGRDAVEVRTASAEKIATIRDKTQRRGQDMNDTLRRLGFDVQKRGQNMTYDLGVKRIKSSEGIANRRIQASANSPEGRILTTMNARLNSLDDSLTSLESQKNRLQTEIAKGNIVAGGPEHQRAVSAINAIDGNIKALNAEKTQVLGEVQRVRDALGDKMATPNGVGPSVAPGVWKSAGLSLADRMGLRLTSGTRPGAVSVTGNPSLHSVGGAIDVAGKPEDMGAYFDRVRREFGDANIKELFYSPKGYIKDGVFYPPGTYNKKVEDTHHDHVHFAGGRGAVQVAEKPRIPPPTAGRTKTPPKKVAAAPSTKKRTGKVNGVTWEWAE